MKMKVVFKTSKVTLEGILNNSETALKIYEKLPIEARVNTWGDEIYFKIPLSLKPENATLDVEAGDIAYWPEGNCLCIFFGKTPVSVDNKPMPASEVNIIGKASGNLNTLKNIRPADKITVIKKSEENHR